MTKLKITQNTTGQAYKANIPTSLPEGSVSTKNLPAASKGKIIDLNQVYITILSEDGSEIKGKPLNFNNSQIGQDVLYSVKHSDGQIYLDIITEEQVESQKKLFSNLLKELSLKDSPDNVKMLQFMIDNNLPLNKDTILKFNQAVKLLGKDNLQEAVFFIENDIRAGLKNSTILMGYKDNSISLPKQLTVLADLLKNLQYSSIQSPRINNTISVKEISISHQNMPVKDIPSQEIPASSKNNAMPESEIPAPNKNMSTQEIPASSKEMPVSSKNIAMPSLEMPVPNKNMSIQEIPILNKNITINSENISVKEMPVFNKDMPALEMTILNKNITVAEHATFNRNISVQNTPISNNDIPSPEHYIPDKNISASISNTLIQGGHTPNSNIPVFTKNPFFSQNLFVNQNSEIRINTVQSEGQNLGKAPDVPVEQYTSTILSKHNYTPVDHQNTVKSINTPSETVVDKSIIRSDSEVKVNEIVRDPSVAISNVTQLAERTLLFDFLNNTPVDLNKFFNDLQQAIIDSKLGAAGTPNEAAIYSMADDIIENLNFMNQINTVTYAQIPALINQRDLDVDLYIFNKDDKNKKAKPKDTGSALISLKLPALGLFEVYAQRDHKSISCQFRIENPSIESLIRTHIQELSSKLSSLNYSLDNIQFKHISEKFTVVDNEPKLLSETDTIKHEDKRITFDMRT